MKMNSREWISLFLTHAFFSSSSLFALLLIMERLAPGSVLTFFDFFWLLPVVFIFAYFMPMKRKQTLRWMALLAPLGILLIAFLFFVTRGLGFFGLVPVGALVCFEIVFFLVIAYRES
ncbi:MAG TPA: hypothetical protein VFQ60_05415 [Patescibacteria group bacterium]|nr:hypothetical protein [Patescibacteria group bacterium]